MSRLLKISLALLALLVSPVVSAADTSVPRPNILWITSEDNSPYLGCYGDALAQTPHLDKLAAGGIRYRNAFANAPVCSASRSTLITGMYASSLGVQNHRSKVTVPDGFQTYPEVLRAAGYYCTNNAKTDYNIPRAPATIWNESSKEAHYRNRKAGQPFFAVFNILLSHESQVAPKNGKTAFRVSPEQIPLPPFHPDTPDIRRDWANYYDQITLMDEQVGKLLAELTQQGLADDTIVFYYGDHGGALPRGKRNIHDSGTRVPLIVRIPQKWAAWQPVPAGGWSDQLVSFVDLPATLCSLTGASVPKNYEGRAFLGPAKVEPRGHVYLFRGRMDERYDTVRAVRDGQYRYVKNYTPHRPWGQHYSYPFEVQPSMKSWFAEYQTGRCNAAQSAYWQPKAPEELYEIAKDLFEVANLASVPDQQERLARMRQQLRSDIIATRDTVFIPEGMYTKLAGDKTLYEYCHSEAYPIELILGIADLATSREASALPELVKAMSDPHPVIRYWGATGCLVLQKAASPARAQLVALLKDEWFDVRTVAAEALATTDGQMPNEALAALSEVISQGESYEALAALNSLDAAVTAGQVPAAKAQDLVRHLNLKEPAGRVQRHLLAPDA